MFLLWDERAACRDGQVVEIVAIGTELMQLRNALDQLSTSEERLGFALGAADLGLWDYDVVHGTVERNSRWHELLGRAVGSIAPTVDAWRELVHPDDLERVLEATDGHFAGESRGWAVDYRLRHADGSWVCGSRTAGV